MSRLYWIGMYEARESTKWEWFFQVDLAPAIGYCTKRVVGEGMPTLLSYYRVMAIASIDVKTYSHVVAVPLRWPVVYLFIGQLPGQPGCAFIYPLLPACPPRFPVGNLYRRLCRCTRSLVLSECTCMCNFSY